MSQAKISMCGRDKSMGYYSTMDEAALAYDIATIQHRGAKAAYKLNRPDHPEVIAELAKAMQPGYQLIMPPPQSLADEAKPAGKKPRKAKASEDADGGSGAAAAASSGVSLPLGIGSLPAGVASGMEHAGYSVLGMGDGSDAMHGGVVGMVTDPVAYAQYYHAMTTALDGAGGVGAEPVTAYAPVPSADGGSYSDPAALAAAMAAGGSHMGGDSGGDGGMAGMFGGSVGGEYA